MSFQAMKNSPSTSLPLDNFPAFDDAPPEVVNLNESTGFVSSMSPEYNGDLRSSSKAPVSHDLPLSKKPGRKSVSEALGNLRTRNGSVSANAQELAVALKAPVSYKLIVLCIIWYMTSALTNTSSKSILDVLPQPITLTLVQFGFVSAWCLLLAYLASTFPSLKHAIPALKNGIRKPSYKVVSTAMPLALFSLGGHILSSMATSQIPVSQVHTIKGLSPLFTVLAYRFFFRIKYARATYLSLVPLTIGVMLACLTGLSTNLFGIIYAFSAAIVFVAQNIFSKKLFNEASRVEAEGQTRKGSKLDKINLLCYCSAIAFFFTAPIWFLSEGYYLIGGFFDGTFNQSDEGRRIEHQGLALQFFFNGLFHFAQNILAFVLLSTISPVSYSVASLIKRVFVIVVAIIWFQNPTTSIQALGIILTFVGLYLYDRNNHDDAADRRANADHFQHNHNHVLPLHTSSLLASWDSGGHQFPSLSSTNSSTGTLHMESSKKEDISPTFKTNTSHMWLPPGTRQESTWQPGDANMPPINVK